MRLQTTEFESLLEANARWHVGGWTRPALITFVNRRMESMFGYDGGDRRRAHRVHSVPESFRQVHGGHRRYYNATQRSGRWNDLISERTATGRSQFPGGFALSHSDTADGLLVIAAVREHDRLLGLRSKLQRPKTRTLVSSGLKPC